MPLVQQAVEDVDETRTGLAKSGGMPQFLRATRWERLYASTAAGSPASAHNAQGFTSSQRAELHPQLGKCRKYVASSREAEPSNISYIW